MIALLLQASLGDIGRQTLPKGACAAYLWSVGEPRRFVAMALPERLRLRLDGKPLDLVRTDGEGAIVQGLAASTTYAAGGTSATLTMTVTERPDIVAGALVSDATLTVAPAGRDATVVPVGGLVGCG